MRLRRRHRPSGRQLLRRRAVPRRFLPAGLARRRRRRALRSCRHHARAAPLPALARQSSMVFCSLADPLVLMRKRSCIVQHLVQHLVVEEVALRTGLLVDRGRQPHQCHHCPRAFRPALRWRLAHWPAKTRAHTPICIVQAVEGRHDGPPVDVHLAFARCCCATRDQGVGVGRARLLLRRVGVADAEVDRRHEPVDPRPVVRRRLNRAEATSPLCSFATPMKLPGASVGGIRRKPGDFGRYRKFGRWVWSVQQCQKGLVVCGGAFARTLWRQSKSFAISRTFANMMRMHADAATALRCTSWEKMHGRVRCSDMIARTRHL